MAPPPRLKISEWADRYAYLPPGTAESGKFHLDRLPYQAAMLDDAIDPSLTEFCWMFAKQICKTTSFTLQNGYFIDQDPSTILIVYPTLDDAKTYMKDKLVPFIQATPRLRAKVPRHKSRNAGQTILHKQFPGGNISACGANSPSSLRQRSKRVVQCDEIDSMRANAEGDPIAQADGRAETFHNAVKGKSSTPTIKGLSRIEQKFDFSDKQYWFVPCPHCGAFQILKWGQIKFTFETGFGPRDGYWKKSAEQAPPEATTKYRDTANTVYVCENKDCGSWWSDADRIQAIGKGEWRATAPFKRVRGRHLNGIYRILGKKTAYESYLHEFAEQFLEAHRGGRWTLIVWTNTFLAETFEEVAERLDASAFEQRREQYTPDALPAGVLVLTAGVDFQQDRAEVQVTGWGEGFEAWGVEYRIIPGNPLGPQLYRDLDTYLNNLTVSTADGRRLRIAAAGLDTGFATDHVYAYCRPRYARRIFALKGSSQPGSPLIGSLSRANRRRCPVYRIGTDTAKSEIYGNLRLAEPGPGYWHWPVRADLGFDARYFAGLTAEEMTVQYVKGFPRRAWVLREGRWNEQLDTAVYARAAVAILQPAWQLLKTAVAAPRESAAALASFRQQAHTGGSQSESAAPSPVATAPPPPAVESKTRPGFLFRPRRPGGWIKGWK